MKFDKTTLLNNIYYLAREKNLKIGDIEKNAGVSTGYISRINKEENNTIPGIDFVCAIANELGTTVDYLLTCNLRDMDKNEKYISDFIERLYSETVMNQLEWKSDLKSVLDSNKKSEASTHPLYCSVEYVAGRDIETGYPNYETEYVYNSMFHKDGLVELENNIVSAAINSSNDERDYDAYVYIAPVTYSMEYQDEEEVTDEYEVYIVKESYGEITSIPLVNTGFIGGGLEDQIDDLYKTAQEYAKHVKIDSSARSIIDSFMYTTELPF